jgi:predicted nucleic acid-binding protein
LKIARQSGYGIDDALDAAAALAADCSTLYSEDLQDGQVTQGQFTMRNPFH